MSRPVSLQRVMFISEDDIKQFSEDGAIVLRKVFSDDWVEKVKAGIEENLASPSKYSERLAVREGEVSGMTGENDETEIRVTTSMTTATGSGSPSSGTTSSTRQLRSWPPGSWSPSTPSSTTSTSSTRSRVRWRRCC